MTAPAGPWERESQEKWNEVASRTSTVTLLPDEKNPTRIRVEGKCPACGHQTVHSEPLQLVSVADAVPSVARAARRSAKQATVEALCDCSGSHTGAPADGTGCGRSWALTVRW